MNPLKALKKLFGSKQRVKPLLKKDDRIQLREAFWGHLEGHNETYKAIGDLITIQTDQELKFIHFKDGRYYFVLFSQYIEQHEDKGTVVYFSETTFLNRLKYRIL